MVITSRSLRGGCWIPAPAAATSRGMGAIFADPMTGPQARIELMLALGVHGGDVEAIRNVVEAGRYEP